MSKTGRLWGKRDRHAGFINSRGGISGQIGGNQHWTWGAPGGASILTETTV